MSQKNMYASFREWGNFLYIVGVLMVVGFIANFLPILGISLIISIAKLVFTILALSKIKEANTQLGNSNLADYYSKLITSVIISLIASAFSAADLIIVAAILTYVSIIIEYMGAKSLVEFFTVQQNLFPQPQSRDALEGAEKLKSAALMMLLFFFIITIFIGAIFYLIGYFKLGGAMKTLSLDYSAGEYQQPPSQIGYQQPGQFGNQQPPAPGFSNEQSSTPKFCRKCGASLEPGARFCPSCGSNI